MFLEPKEIEIDGKTFTISKFPAVIGREIVSRYSYSALPGAGDYKVNEEMMLKVMKHVSTKTASGQDIVLSHAALIDSHVPNFEMLLKLEYAVMEYNISFLQHGGVSTFFDELKEKLPAWGSKMLTVFSERLSQKSKQPSTTSEHSTH